MKKVYSLLMMLAMMFAALSFTACSSSSDDDSSNVNYTSDEIEALLKGKWMISGELRVNNSVLGESYVSRYKGTIEFKNNRKVAFIVTEGDKYYLDGVHYIYLQEKIIRDDYKYSIIKKDGKSYIGFGSPNYLYDFEIVSLNNNSLKLVLDKYDFYFNSEPAERIYMTISSNHVSY